MVAPGLPPGMKQTGRSAATRIVVLGNWARLAAAEFGCYHAFCCILTTRVRAVKANQMARCDVCGKGTAFGRNIRHKHAGRWERKAPKTTRTFKANVQKKAFVIDGQSLRLNVCTRCLRTQLKVSA